MPERHVQVDTPNWDTKVRCSCGADFASRCEFWKHGYEALLALDTELIEMTMQHHLGAPSPEGWVLCLCCETFEGPVFHRRHVASLIAAGEMCEPECRHPRHKVDPALIDGSIGDG